MGFDDQPHSQRDSGSDRAIADRRWIVLMGLRASGKSSVAEALAARRGRRVIDLDARVRAFFGGRTVAEIWACDGEPAFRRAEARCLSEVLEEPAGVLALGGGTAMVPAAAATLREAADAGRIFLVYLRSDVDRLIRRLEADRGDRPPLVAASGDDAAAATGPADDVAREVAWAFDERDPVYRGMASLIVDVDAVLGGDSSFEPADGPRRLAAFIDAALAAP